jgi:NAD(P)H-hydrate epimerase
VLLDKFARWTGKIVIVGGTGQNGGDGWVVARHLHDRGIPPVAVLLGDESTVQGDAKVNLDVLRSAGIELHTISIESAGSLRDVLADATLVVDAMFGTGLTRAIAGGYAEAVRVLVQCGAPVLALDVPSGIDANTGAVLGVAVGAQVTATFAAHKRGLHQHPGVDHAGEIVLCSVGVPEPSDAPAQLFEADDVLRLLPVRAPDVHKGLAGHVLVVAGSPGKTGAAFLSGHGAMRAGAGLVTLAARGSARDALDRKVVELMTAALAEDATAAVDAALELAGRMDAAVVGPGLGLDDDGRTLARELAMRLPIPAVLDADALTALGDDLSILEDAKGPRVLTPHPGEAARLLGCTTAEVQADRYGASLRIAQASGHVAILKGARTVVAAPDGRIRVCRRGTPALGVAGTGDVLSGVVAAHLAVLDPLPAAAVAVVLHAIAGEIAAVSDRGLLAREVADAIPRALCACRTGHR